jgi:hypothetical protein
MHLGLIDRPFVPHNLISAQESPVAFPKFQLNLIAFWIHKRNLCMLYFSLKRSWQANPSMFSNRATMERDAHLQSLFYLSSRVSSKGALQVPFTELL